METVNVGRAVVDVLQAEGVRFVFGLPGGHVLSVYDALYATPSIRLVLVRHEQAAASMAAAHAQLTGEPGVCLVTAGPGATNLLTGIAEAYVGSLPVVVIAGRGATPNVLRGAAQEVATERIFAPVTKWSVRVDQPELVVEALHQAFATARSGKPDRYSSTCRGRPRRGGAGAAPRPGRDAALVAAAAEALAGAERPLLVAGGGAVAADASAELVELAELLAAPVLTSLAGRVSIPDGHPLSAGGLGAHRTRLSKRLLAEADVVLGLGTRFEEMETNWREGSVPAPDAMYVQVDVDPVEIGRSVPAALGLVGDVRVVVLQLLEALTRTASPREAREWRRVWSGGTSSTRRAPVATTCSASVRTIAASAPSETSASGPPTARTGDGSVGEPSTTPSHKRPRSPASARGDPPRAARAGGASGGRRHAGPRPRAAAANRHARVSSTAPRARRRRRARSGRRAGGARPPRRRARARAPSSRTAAPGRAPGAIVTPRAWSVNGSPEKAPKK